MVEYICYSCGAEFEDDNDIVECPYCESYDVEDLLVAMEEAELF